MPDNRKPLMYGAFPVCRNYTVRAHICHAGFTKRRGRENRQQYAGALRCRIHTPHLHPRHPPKTGRSRTDHGQLHGTGDVKAENDKNTGEETELPLRCSFALSAYFRVWVTVWVRRLTHILTHTSFDIFATKKHRKRKFSMLFGAAGRIRTADLILTKDALYLLSYSSIWRPRWGSNPRPPA